MVFVSVLPVELLQLEVAFTQGYDAARNLAFYNRNLVLLRARFPGDTLLILGMLVFAYDMVRKRFALRSVATSNEAAASRSISERVLTEDDD